MPKSHRRYLPWWEKVSKGITEGHLPKSSCRYGHQNTRKLHEVAQSTFAFFMLRILRYLRGRFTSTSLRTRRIKAGGRRRKASVRRATGRWLVSLNPARQTLRRRGRVTAQSLRTICHKSAGPCPLRRTPSGASMARRTTSLSFIMDARVSTSIKSCKTKRSHSLGERCATFVPTIEYVLLLYLLLPEVQVCTDQKKDLKYL